MSVRNLPERETKKTPGGYEGRYLWLVVICMIAFGAIGLRLWNLQIIDGERYYRASTDNIIRQVEVQPPRGEILDREGVALAENRPAYDVYVDSNIFSANADEEVHRRLQAYLDLSDDAFEGILSRIESSRGEVLIRRDVSRADVARLEEDQLRLPGIEVRTSHRRYYPLHHVGAHSLGYVSEVNAEQLRRLHPYGYRRGHLIGQMGLERSFEEILHGSPGLEREVVDARGNPLSEADTEFLIGEYQQIRAVAGRDVVTNLDADLMVIIDEAFEDYAAGAAVAVDPRDGRVRAMYSKPHFNPNAWSGRLSSMEKLRSDSDPFHPMMDKTVSRFFPGSVYKIIGAWMGLAEDHVEADDEYYCPGYHDFGGHRFRCWRDGGHGDVDAYSAMAQSCNVYYYEMAEELGLDVLAEYARAFGFGETTGIELSREDSGRVPDRQWHESNSPEGYQRGFDLNSVVGSGDTLATPLQVVMAYAAIANGGDLYYPQLVDEIRGDSGDVLFDYAPQVRKELDIDPEHLEVLRESLRQVVASEDGTARGSSLDHTPVAGKTGTAQVAQIGSVRIPHEERELHLRNHAWFSAFAPYDDPEIALVVFLEHGGGGGGDAAPVAMEILDRYLTRDDRAALDVRLGDRRAGGGRQ